MIAPFYSWARRWALLRTACTDEADNRTTVATQDLLRSRCTIMLGLPGMGKTSEMQVLRQLAVDRGIATDFITLSSIVSAEQLETQLLTSNGVQAWLGGGAWSILLDGLDEAIIDADKIMGAVDSVIRKVQARAATYVYGNPAHADALTLRISCRAAEWSHAFESNLGGLFEGSLDVVELAELEWQDALNAGAATGLSASAWENALDQLDNAGADALIRRPITLKILLNIFQQTGELPRQQVPLYRRGVQAFLEEANVLGRQTHSVSHLDTNERMLVAGRIAAATIFANTTTISITALAEISNAEAVPIADLAGGAESLLGEAFRVGEGDIIEILRTALFRPLTESLFQWSHRTFAEFLAAQYLVERGLSTGQLLEFLGRAAEPQGIIPPPLYEVASWIASMREDFFEALIVRQPAILLRSDVTGATDISKARLVAHLLTEFNQGRLFDDDSSLRRQFSKLSHPGLADQLRPFIIDRQYSFMARRIAIQIAAACKTTVLASDLIDCSLDPSEETHIRVQALAAAHELATPEQRGKLRPLVSPGDAADEDDELRGWALASLWPGLITFEELLEALTQRKRDNFLGQYWRFRRDLSLALSPVDAVKAVAWVQSRAPVLDSEHDSGEEELLTNLMTAAWEQSGDDRVRDAFADFALGASKANFTGLIYTPRFSAFIQDYISGPAEKRYHLASEVFRRLTAEGKSARLSINGRWPLLVPSDVPWLLAQLGNKEKAVEETAFIDAIISLLHAGGIADRADVWETAEAHPRLAAALVAGFTTQLDDDISQYLRQESAGRIARAQAADQASAFNRADAVSRRLARAAEHIEEWWTYNLLFFTDDLGRLSGDEFAMDLAAQPMWSTLREEEQAASLNWAEAYLRNDAPISCSWVGTNTFHRPAAAAYRALRLLRSERPQQVLKLPETVWSRWAHAILAVSANEDSAERGIRTELAVSAYRHAPRAVLMTLLRLLFRAEDGAAGRHALERVGHAYDDQLGDLLWRVAQRKKLAPAIRVEVISYLLGREHARACETLAWELQGGGTGDALNLGKDDFVKLAAAFLYQFPESGWERLQKLENRELARSIFLAAHASHGLGWFPLDRISDAKLSEIYLWIETEFPPPSEEKNGWVTLEDQVQFTRRAALNQLVQRGTSTSVEAVRQIVAKLPEQFWLKNRLVEAERIYQTQSWRWDTPASILRQIASYGTALPLRSTKQELNNAAQKVLKGLVPDEQPTLLNPAPSIVPAEVVRENELKILSVATEWSSAHGGLSTLNRDLCIALAAEGHRVACLVIDANNEEEQDAAARGITLLKSGDDAGVEDVARLFLAPFSTLTKLGVDLVIGHDHITGPAAHHIARRLLNVPYVHFVHTIPEEIEAYKSPYLHQSLARGADKGQVQLKQCKGANLIVAVGPRIFADIQGKMGATPRVIQLNPGLSAELLDFKHNPPETSVVILFQGRMEHAELKGAKLAYQATKLFRADPSIKPYQEPSLIIRGVTPQELENSISIFDDEAAVKSFVKTRFYSVDKEVLSADLSSASLVLMPSKTEGFGLVALEAIAAGIPVLISSRSGIAQLLKLDPAIQSGTDCATIDASICDVEGPPDQVAASWCNQIKAILCNRDFAFDRARKLRQNLSMILTWPAAAKGLIVEFEKLLGR
ncbi:glycosyltransferase [Sphingomonas sp.]|uniref:glycosyltransferase n=1 Tax=Sphingomonas sp. TaxID=28214 RepID=UPI003B3B5EC4